MAITCTPSFTCDRCGAVAEGIEGSWAKAEITLALPPDWSTLQATGPVAVVWDTYTGSRLLCDLCSQDLVTFVRTAPERATKPLPKDE